MRLAAVLRAASFLWGAAGVHIHTRRSRARQRRRDWTDIVIPVIGFTLLWLQRGYDMEGRSGAPLPRLCRK
jgi:hypothetical protein